MTNDQIAFLPYLVLLLIVFVLLLGCMCYRLTKSVNNIFEAAITSSRIPHSEETRSRYCPQNVMTASQRSGREILAQPLPLANENSIRLVESLLHENLNRASIAEREARRLAIILANSRGMSEQEFLASSLRPPDESLPGPPRFMPTQFQDDFEQFADMPPTYEEVLGTNTVSISMDGDSENRETEKLSPSETEPEPTVKTP